MTSRLRHRAPGQTLDQVLSNVPGLLVLGAPFYVTDPTGQNIKFRGMDKKVLVPRLVAGAGVAWRTTERWSQAVDVRYKRPMTLSSLSLTPAFEQGSYTVFNLSTTYRINERFEVAGAVVNLFDKRYTDSSASNPQGINYAMPRTARVSLRVSF
jgi:outer membrane receptor protein involved in Fe transport